jgi:hypothetical protein
MHHQLGGSTEDDMNKMSVIGHFFLFKMSWITWLYTTCISSIKPHQPHHVIGSSSSVQTEGFIRAMCKQVLKLQAKHNYVYQFQATAWFLFYASESHYQSAKMNSHPKSTIFSTFLNS